MAHSHHQHEHQHPGGDPSATVYTCPMHPEIRQSTPGRCPKCGMALEPLIPTPKEAPVSTVGGDPATAVYTCPMHPEIRQPTPGKCPKCGMFLEPAPERTPA